MENNNINVNYLVKCSKIFKFSHTANCYTSCDVFQIVFKNVEIFIINLIKHLLILRYCKCDNSNIQLAFK